MNNIISNTQLTFTYTKPLIKQLYGNLKCGKIAKLESVNIFSMPTRISDKDVLSMFKGLLSLINEKSAQQQTEKYLNLKLKYERLKYLYSRLKIKKKENRNSL